MAKKKIAAKKKKRTLPKEARPYMWKKGQSGNPNGRPPKAQTLTTMLRNMLDEPANRVPKIKSIALNHGLDPDKTTIGAVIVLSLADRACHGSSPAIGEILERTEGKVPMKVQLGDNPLAEMDDATMQELFNRASDPKKEKK